MDAHDTDGDHHARVNLLSNYTDYGSTINAYEHHHHDTERGGGERQQEETIENYGVAADDGGDLYNTAWKYIDGNLQLAKRSQVTRKWRIAFVWSIALVFAAIVALLAAVIGFAFLRSPHIAVEQIQLYQRPVAEINTVGFQVVFRCDNPNLWPVDITELAMQFVVVDGIHSIEYVIDRDIHSNDTVHVESLALKRFKVMTSIDLLGLPNTKQVKNAILSSAHGLKLTGMATYSVGPLGGALTYSQEISKQQLYNRYLIPKVI